MVCPIAAQKQVVSPAAPATAIGIAIQVQALHATDTPGAQAEKKSVQILERPHPKRALPGYFVHLLQSFSRNQEPVCQAAVPSKGQSHDDFRLWKLQNVHVNANGMALQPMHKDLIGHLGHDANCSCYSRYNLVKPQITPKRR